MSEQTETAAEKKPRARVQTSAPGSETRRPCVGLPVQYHNGTEILPGILQRQSRTDESLWDVKVLLSGAATLVTRAAVPQSLTPKSGHWNFLPQ